MPKQTLMTTWFRILLLVIPLWGNILAQEKFEKESRIGEKEVPTQALLFLAPLNLSKVKWYKEEGLNGTSIEVKFKAGKARYSVEFDTLGRVEDIEIEADWDDLASGLRDSIAASLNSHCIQHKVIKVQRHYKGDEAELFSIIRDGKNIQSLTHQYELIVRCNEEHQVDQFEYLFSNTGQLVSRSKIVFRNSSHLEY